MGAFYKGGRPPATDWRALEHFSITPMKSITINKCSDKYIAWWKTIYHLKNTRNIASQLTVNHSHENISTISISVTTRCIPTASSPADLFPGPVNCLWTIYEQTAPMLSVNIVGMTHRHILCPQIIGKCTFRDTMLTNSKMVLVKLAN